MLFRQRRDKMAVAGISATAKNYTGEAMKKILLTLLLTAVMSLFSCEAIGEPIDTGVDSDGVDAGIEWMYEIEVYPTYGVDRQRQKHYYTYDVTSEEIDEYMTMLTEELGYVVMDSYGTALSEDEHRPTGTYVGAEAFYVLARRGKTTIHLTYIYQDNGTWMSEVDS